MDEPLNFEPGYAYISCSLGVARISMYTGEWEVVRSIVPPEAFLEVLRAIRTLPTGYHPYPPVGLAEAVANILHDGKFLYFEVPEEEKARIKELVKQGVVF